MRGVKDPPEWYVYVYDAESEEMKEYNIFDHKDFVRDIKRFYKENPRPPRKATDQAVRLSLMKYFWCSEDWEIYLFPIFIRDKRAVKKIDVFSQIALNFEAFVDYVIKHREGIEHIKGVRA